MAGGADLGTVCERLAWACEYLRHLNTLMEPVRQALREDTHGAFQIKREQGGQIRLYSVSHVPPIPPDVPLVLGDCVHNLRGTLDNLIFVVGSDNTPGGLSSAQESASAFPITQTACQFSAKSGVGAGLQPFRHVPRQRSSGCSRIRRMTPPRIR